MNDLLWVGPVLITFWLAFLSLSARRWWFAPYLGTAMFVCVCGVFVSAWPAFWRHVWWDGWSGYMLTVPIARTMGWRLGAERWEDAAQR